MKMISRVLMTAVAVAALAAPAVAADKLIVQNAAGTANVFKVQDNGNTGFNLATANYPADVVSPGNLNRSQLHFSLSGADSGGFIVSLAENNFYLSSGGAYDGPAGGWIQKSSDGKSIFFGSGAAGFKAFVNSGNTPGAVMTNLLTAFMVDYSGNMGVGTTTMTQKLEVNGGVRLNTATAQPACTATSRGTIWVTQGTTDKIEVCLTTGTGLGWKQITLP